MKRWKVATLAFLLIGAVIGATIWNYTEPWTSAYEINPVTLEVRSVEYLDRPITGMCEHRVAATKQMSIGEWLIDSGYLEDQAAGYWTLCKSYNPRWGFKKGDGRALQSCFDQAGFLTAMPHPDVESPNSEWRDWCTRHPGRAELLWDKYAELVESREMWRAGDMLRMTLRNSDQLGNDGDFESFLNSY